MSVEPLAEADMRIKRLDDGRILISDTCTVAENGDRYRNYRHEGRDLDGAPTIALAAIQKLVAAEVARQMPAALARHRAHRA